MDPVTHALVSATLDRVGFRRVSPRALLILIISGTAADLDLLSYLGGASPYFHYHYAVLHSILGSAVLTVLLAMLLWLFVRGPQTTRLNFTRVLLLCLIGTGTHVLLDSLGAEGVQLLWPFRMRWFSADLLPQIDPWILAVIFIALLVPMLLRLVSEEIGERKKKKPVSKGACAALALIAVYIAARGMLHQRAMQLLMSHDYHGAAPLTVGAFPDSTSLLLWHGVVETTNSIELVSIPVGPGDVFASASSLTSYKPGGSPALAAAQHALLAKEFLLYARFPLAELQDIPNGTLVTLRDMRFAQDTDTFANFYVTIELDSNMRPRSEEIEFPSQAK